MYYIVLVIFGLVLIELFILLGMEIYSKISDCWHNAFNTRID